MADAEIGSPLMQDCLFASVPAKAARERTQVQPMTSFSASPRPAIANHRPLRGRHALCLQTTTRRGLWFLPVAELAWSPGEGPANVKPAGVSRTPPGIVTEQVVPVQRTADTSQSATMAERTPFHRSAWRRHDLLQWAAGGGVRSIRFVRLASDLCQPRAEARSSVGNTTQTPVPLIKAPIDTSQVPLSTLPTPVESWLADVRTPIDFLRRSICVCPDIIQIAGASAEDKCDTLPICWTRALHPGPLAQLINKAFVPGAPGAPPR